MPSTNELFRQQFQEAIEDYKDYEWFYEKTN